jgi:hypothetical protein
MPSTLRLLQASYAYVSYSSLKLTSTSQNTLKQHSVPWSSVAR